MGSWTSDAQRALARCQEEIESGDISRDYDYLYAARDTAEALTLLQMGSGHHPQVKDDIDELALQVHEVLSRMSTWGTMEEDEPISEEEKQDLKNIIDEALELSMEYRDPGFKLESIRH